MFRGRVEELARLGLAIAGASVGQSGALVIRGAAGVGKSALLQATEDGAETRVLRATGVLTESDLPFAALHQLLRPAFGLLTELPAAQRSALEGALGLGPARADDRILVSAGVLTLLAACADPELPGGGPGLLCVVDDAHWLDRPSLDALLFASRRLDAEGVVILFGVREGEEQDLNDAGLPTVELTGLSEEDASHLLAAHSGGRPAPVVVKTLVTMTAGNALALVELADLLTADELAGRRPLPDPLPVSADLEQTFLARARTLPDSARLALLVCAADGRGDLRAVLAAAELLGVPSTTLDAAEAAGLITVDGGALSFRHPLVRSAVYGGAASSQRRKVHSALAACLTGEADADRRAGHRALAATGPDEDVAAALAASADRARMRSGFAAAASALQRAADLTVDASLRAERLVAAATDAWLAGRPDQSLACLDQVSPGGELDPSVTDRVAHLRGRLELRCGIATDAHLILLEAGCAAVDRVPTLALEMFAEASEAASYAGDVPAMVALGSIAADVETDGDEAVFLQDVTVGVADMIAGRSDDGTARLARAVRHVSAPTTPPGALVWGAAAALYIGDSVNALALIKRAVAGAQVAAMVGALPYTLEYLANIERIWGRYSSGQALSEEGLALATDTGQESSVCMHLANLAAIAAVRGEEQQTRDLAEQALSRALPRQLGLPAGHASAALAVLDVGHGRFAEGLARIRDLAASGIGANHPTTTLFLMPDWIEAALRSGERDEADECQRRFEAWATETTSPALRGLALRTKGLLADDEDAEACFTAALHDEMDGPPFEKARTQLSYGEWLRRMRRPGDARAQLRSAAESFERLGARPWAERAQRELRAAGETDGTKGKSQLAELTAQELRIARAVAAGGSNRDIAAQMFLSPRTVEYHLYKVYPKLGIASRTELVRLLADLPAEAPG